MATFHIEVIGRSREVYAVETESEDEARAYYERNIGHPLFRPIVSEVDDTEVRSITKADD
jgi:hypothetical protein